MYLAITGKGKARVLQFCEQERIPGTKKKKTKVLKTIGNYERLLEENPNILEELKEEAREWTKRKKEERKTQLFRFGHSLILRMWKELELDAFFIKHLGEKEAKAFLGHLYPLVVYRLGSSYQNFRVNRKTPFLNLRDVSYSNFYHSLEVLASLQEKLTQQLQSFFEKKTKRRENPIYLHRSLYQYNAYWKDVHGGFLPQIQMEKNNISFSMCLALDAFGIPISFSLEQEEAKKEKNFDEHIALLEEIKPPDTGDFLLSQTFATLDIGLQNKILEEKDWFILERHSETQDILYKEKTLLVEKQKIYINWSKSRAFRDYTEGNGKQGYYCLITNRLSLDSSDMLKMFQHTRNIEDKFRISNVDFHEKQIQGHFTLCFLCLSIVSYFQYLLGSEGRAFIPMIYASKAISNPMVLLEGKKYPYEVYPIHITNSYKKLSRLLGLGEISTKMSLEEFEHFSQFSLLKQS